MVDDLPEPVDPVPRQHVNEVHAPLGAQVKDDAFVQVWKVCVQALKQFPVFVAL